MVIWAAGIAGAINLSKFIKIGGDYNCSWNNRPDDCIIDVDPYKSAYIHHLAKSNECGAGILILNNKVKLSIAGKKNWETDNYRAEKSPLWYWPEGLSPVWSEKKNDYMILTSLSINISRLTVIAHFDFYKYNWHLFQLFFQQYPSYLTF